MVFNPLDVYRAAARGQLIGKQTTEETIAFVMAQIANPFGSGDANYFKKISKEMEVKDDLDEVCMTMFTKIQDVYPDLRIDVSDVDVHLNEICSSVYKFFIVNAAELLYSFIRQFIFNDQNRRVLTDEFSSGKSLAQYPKEQYGKREFFILIVKLQDIVDEIFNDNAIKLKEFIRWLRKSDDCRRCVKDVKKLLDEGIISDSGVVSNMYRLYKESDIFRGDMNKLEMEITSSLIIPYIEAKGMAGVRLPRTEDPPEETDDNEEQS